MKSSKYSWDAVEKASDEYAILDEAVNTLRVVIDELKEAPNQIALMHSLQDLVDESENRLDELNEIMKTYAAEEAKRQNEDYRRSVL